MASKARVLGQTPAETAGFHGSRSAQRAGAAQALVTATPLTGAAGANPTQAEYLTVVTRLNSAVVLINELQAALVDKGIIKGSA